MRGVFHPLPKLQKSAAKEAGKICTGRFARSKSKSEKGKASTGGGRTYRGGNLEKRKS